MIYIYISYISHIYIIYIYHIYIYIYHIYISCIYIYIYIIYIYIIYRADILNYSYSKTSQELWIKKDHHEMGIINYRLRSFTKGPRSIQ